MRLLAAAAALLVLVGPAWAQDVPSYDVRAAFARFDPGYVAQRRAALARMEPLLETLFAREEAGEAMTCADQIGKEARWLVGYTADYARIARRTDDLAAELARPTPTPVPDVQQGPEGHWASCHEEDFFKLSVDYDKFVALTAAGKAPAMRPAYLDAYNDAARLRARFLALMTSDIRGTGMNQRRALNEEVSDVMRLILRDQPLGYDWQPGLKDALKKILVDDLRDPATGYWGARFTDGDKIVRTADLSVTFHVVRYLQGDVPDWPRIVDTTLAIRDRRYSQGWQASIGPLNHHLYDVAAIFKLGWTKVDAPRQAAMAAELKKMLDWSLKETLGPDGTFKLTEEDDSFEEAQYFGVALLAAAGLFDKDKPYWADAPYPDAAGIRDRIARRVSGLLAAGNGSTGGAYYRSAMELLGG